MIELVKNTKALNFTDNKSNIEFNVKENNITISDTEKDKAIPVDIDNTNITLTNNMLKGDNGGYYIPSVEDGILYWTPTEPDMPPVEETTIFTAEGLASEIYVDDKVGAEATTRAEADLTLQKNIEEEIARASNAENTNALAIVNLQNEDTKINYRIDEEVTAREETHAQIKAECKVENDNIKILIGDETTRALEAERALQSAIDTEAINREAAINEALAKIPDVDLTGVATETYVENVVNTERVRALKEERALQAAINNEILERTYAIEEVIALIPDVEDIDLTEYAKTSYVDEKVASIIDTAPEALNTLNELSAALGDDPNFATTVSTEIGKKVDKEEGKVLTTNDFTNDYKTKLDGIADNANNYVHPDTHSADIITGLATVATSGDYKDLKNTPEAYKHPDTHPANIITGLSTVATTGSYNDLSNKPTIPAAYTHPATHSADMITGLSTVATSGNYADLTNKPTIPSAYTHPATHPASIITGLATVATSGKYADLSGKPTILNAATGGYNGAITVAADGVAEMGKYIDFHNTSGSPTDFSTRLVCTGENGNTVNLPSTSGTLTIGDKAYKIVVSSTVPTVNDTSIITILV